MRFIHDHAQSVRPHGHAQPLSEACLARDAVAVLPRVVPQPWVALHCTLITTLEYSSSGTVGHTV